MTTDDSRDPSEITSPPKKSPPTGLRKQALLKLLRMHPETRERLLRIEALRRGLPAPPKR